MNYLNQIYYEMRHQRMMTWVSISGTALAIFLVMSFIMADSIGTIAMAPESNRNRIMTGKHIHAKGNKSNTGSTSGLNPDLAARLYEGLEGVEKISYVYGWPSTVDVNTPGQESVSCERMLVDEDFWDIYDFTFIDGRPFNEDERKSKVKAVVIPRSTARRTFGEDMVAGREVEVDMVPYTVVGVVEDTSPLLTGSYAKIYGIYNPATDDRYSNWNGNTTVRLLLAKDTDPVNVKRQVEGRYRQLADEFAREDMELIYHQQPYTQADIAAGGFGSNKDPETKSHNIFRWVVYAILILLPAINLSSMTRSRLRHRVAEIGVRRAFGARRVDIVTQLFGENLIITIIGGIIGLVLSLVFIRYGANMIFTYTEGFDVSLETLDTRPALSMIFRWSNFVIALLICLILNILSATVPAWRASLSEPAEALSSSR